MKRKLFTLLAILPLIAIPALQAKASSRMLPSNSQAQPQTWSCTAAAFHACSFNYVPGWDEYNNTFNDPAMPPNSYTINADNHSYWEVIANQAVCPTLDCAVEAYDSAQFNYANTSGTEEVSQMTWMSSHFSETMPRGNLETNGFDSEAAYDIWLNSYAVEVMIWVDNQGQTPAGGAPGEEGYTPHPPHVRLFGEEFTLYHSGNTFSFVLDRNETTGVINIKDVLDWLVRNNDISSTDYMTQFNFGWEIASTAGQTDPFVVKDLSLVQSFT